MTRRGGDRPLWNTLGVRMGYTRQRSHRAEILAAIARMNWAPAPVGLRGWGGPVARAVAEAIVWRRGAGLRAVGVAPLAGRRQLIGLEDGLGVRSYVLDCGAEAIHLLTEPQQPEQPWEVAAADVEYHPGDVISGRAESAATLIEALVDAHGGNTYRLLRDLADHLGASLAYVDRLTIEAHLQRVLSDAKWAAIRAHFRGMDLDEHLGECGSARTDWIETVVVSAGVADRGRTAHNGEVAPPRPRQAVSERPPGR